MRGVDEHQVGAPADIGVELGEHGEVEAHHAVMRLDLRAEAAAAHRRAVADQGDAGGGAQPRQDRGDRDGVGVAGGGFFGEPGVAARQLRVDQRIEPGAVGRLAGGDPGLGLVAFPPDRAGMGQGGRDGGGAGFGGAVRAEQLQPQQFAAAVEAGAGGQGEEAAQRGAGGVVVAGAGLAERRGAVHQGAVRQQGGDLPADFAQLFEVPAAGVDQVLVEMAVGMVDEHVRHVALAVRQGGGVLHGRGLAAGRGCHVG
jgi:hypothetical protein